MGIAIRAHLRDVRRSPQLAVPAVHAVKTDASSLSHFGGGPRLPPGVEWPERNGKKLAFLARLSLAEIHRAGALTGCRAPALCCFSMTSTNSRGFDPADRGGSAVLLVPDLPWPTLQRGGGLERQTSPFPYRNVVFRSIQVLPSWEREIASVRSSFPTKSRIRNCELMAMRLRRRARSSG